MKKVYPKKGCNSPISAGCVNWDNAVSLCCIDICSDDTVEDIIVKQSNEICRLRKLIDMQYVNTGNIVVSDAKLTTLIQALFDKVNSL